MHVLHLSPYIGSQKTLVITCIECLVDPGSFRNNVYTYSTLSNTLSDNDRSLQYLLRYHVHEKGCTRILVAAHMPCQALDYIMTGARTDANVRSIRAKLTDLRPQYIDCLPRDKQTRMLTELNVCKQGDTLLGHDVVRRMVSKGKLSVEGLVYDAEKGKATKIYHNGISMNTMIKSS